MKYPLNKMLLIVPMLGYAVVMSIAVAYEASWLHTSLFDELVSIFNIQDLFKNSKNPEAAHTSNAWVVFLLLNGITICLISKVIAALIYKRDISDIVKQLARQNIAQNMKRNASIGLWILMVLPVGSIVLINQAHKVSDAISANVFELIMWSIYVYIFAAALVEVCFFLLIIIISKIGERNE